MRFASQFPAIVFYHKRLHCEKWTGSYGTNLKWGTVNHRAYSRRLPLRLTTTDKWLVSCRGYFSVWSTNEKCQTSVVSPYPNKTTSQNQQLPKRKKLFVLFSNESPICSVSEQLGGVEKGCQNFVPSSSALPTKGRKLLNIWWRWWPVDDAGGPGGNSQDNQGTGPGAKFAQWHSPQQNLCKLRGVFLAASI